MDWGTRERRPDRDGKRVVGVISHYATCKRADEVRDAYAIRKAVARRKAAKRGELPFPD